MGSAAITELTLVRRDNILALMKEGGWDRRMFSHKTQVNYSTLSTFLGDHPTSNIGTKIINMIEAAMKKPEDWFDKDRREGPSTVRKQLQNGYVGKVSMVADGFIVKDKQITKYQAKEIMRALIDD